MTGREFFERRTVDGQGRQVTEWGWIVTCRCGGRRIVGKYYRHRGLGGCPTCAKLPRRGAG